MVSSRAAVFFFWIFIHFCAPRGAEPHVAGKFTSSWYYDMCMCPNNSAFYPHSSKVIIANVNCNEIVMTWWERLPVLWWKRMRRSEIARVSPIRLLCTSGAAVQQRCRLRPLTIYVYITSTGCLSCGAWKDERIGVCHVWSVVTTCIYEWFKFGEWSGV